MVEEARRAEGNKQMRPSLADRVSLLPQSLFFIVSQSSSDSLPSTALQHQGEKSTTPPASSPGLLTNCSTSSRITHRSGEGLYICFDHEQHLQKADSAVFRMASNSYTAAHTTIARAWEKPHYKPRRSTTNEKDPMARWVSEGCQDQPWNAVRSIRSNDATHHTTEGRVAKCDSERAINGSAETGR